MRHLFRRITLSGVAAAIALSGFAGAASAHVTVNPKTAESGSYAMLTFRVPNEEDAASTTALEVHFPEDHPIAGVSVKPHPGWTYTVTKAAPSKPLNTKHGAVTEVVTAITWTAASPDAAIKPGEFDEFSVSAGPLPEDADSLTFPALQTYSNGDVVRWIETAAPGAPEPAHPAPALTVTASQNAAEASTNDDSAALPVAIAALVISLIAAGGVAFLAVRRRRG